MEHFKSKCYTELRKEVDKISLVLASGSCSGRYLVSEGLSKKPTQLPERVSFEYPNGTISNHENARDIRLCPFSQCPTPWDTKLKGSETVAKQWESRAGEGSMEADAPDHSPCSTVSGLTQYCYHLLVLTTLDWMLCCCSYDSKG